MQDFLALTMKSLKDRIFLLRVEQEMINLLKDQSQTKEMRFADASSYNRMLVHRLATYFGFDHVGDGTHSSVKVTKNEKSRMPEQRLKDLFKEDESIEEPKKLILKRDSSSIEDTNSGASFEKDKSPDIHLNGSLLESSQRRSFEERGEHYERVRARIFNQGSQHSINDSNDDSFINNNKTLDSSGNADKVATSMSSLESEKPQNSCDKIQDHGTGRRTIDTKAHASPKLTESGGQKDRYNSNLNNSNKRTTSNEFRSHNAGNNNHHHHHNDRRNNSNRTRNNRNFPRHQSNNYVVNQGLTNPLPYANAFPLNAPCKFFYSFVFLYF